MPVDMYGASTALTMIATFFGAGKFELFAQQVEQSNTWFDRKLMLYAIYLKALKR